VSRTDPSARASQSAAHSERSFDQTTGGQTPAWPAFDEEAPEMASRNPIFNAPIFLGSAFFVMGLAILEKFLNLFGWSIPFVDVFPRQLLNWAVVLLVFEIALSMRQLVEIALEMRQGAKSRPQPGMN
jgi:hypothetical protein